MDERTPWLDAEAKNLGLQIAGKHDAVLSDIEGQKAETAAEDNPGNDLTGESTPRDLDAATAPEALLSAEPIAAAEDAAGRDGTDATRAFQATGSEPDSAAEEAPSAMLSDLEAGGQLTDRPALSRAQSVVPHPEHSAETDDVTLPGDTSLIPAAIEAAPEGAPMPAAALDERSAAASPAIAPWNVADTATHAAHDDEPSEATRPADDFGFDELEDGIASIFAALHAESSATGEADDLDDGHDPADDALTFLLLGELDRLWHRPDR